MMCILPLYLHVNQKSDDDDGLYNVYFKSYILSTLGIQIKLSNFVIFGPIFMNFSPKCRALNVLFEKRHNAMEKGHSTMEKGHGAAPCKNELGETLF